MPWVPVLLLLAVVYVVLLVVRGLIQFVPWFTEEFIDPRRRVRLKDDSRRSLHGEGREVHRFPLTTASRTATSGTRKGWRSAPCEFSTPSCDRCNS